MTPMWVNWIGLAILASPLVILTITFGIFGDD